MKALILLLLPIFSFGQKIDLPIKDGRLIYETIDTLNGKSKTEIYLVARQWAADKFRSANDVVQLDDKDAAKIVGKFSFQYLYGGVIKEENSATFSIDCKDTKLRLRIYDFVQSDKRMVDTIIKIQQDAHIDVYNKNTWGDLNDAVVKIIDAYKYYIKSKASDNF